MLVKLSYTSLTLVQQKGLELQDEKIVFYDSLYDLIFNKKINFPITESFNKMTPLILDLDMKYKKAESMRYYTDDTIYP